MLFSVKWIFLLQEHFLQIKNRKNMSYSSIVISFENCIFRKWFFITNFINQKSIWFRCWIWKRCQMIYAYTCIFISFGELVKSAQKSKSARRFFSLHWLFETPYSNSAIVIEERNNSSFLQLTIFFPNTDFYFIWGKYRYLYPANTLNFP